MVYFTIYKTTNKINGKFYIGKHQTNDLDDGYLGSGKHLKYAIAKYGKDNFQKEILHICETETEMNAKEKELVILGENSYNLCEGGQGGFGYIVRTRSKEEWIRIGKLSGFKRGKIGGKKLLELKRGIFDPKYKEKIREKARQMGFERFKGQFHTKETKQKLSLSHKGKHTGQKNSQYGTCWIYHPKLKLNKKIKKIEIDKYIDLGYIRGRKKFCGRVIDRIDQA